MAYRFVENDVWVTPSLQTRVAILKVMDSGQLIIGGKSPQSEALMISVETHESLYKQMLKNPRKPNQGLFFRRLKDDKKIVQTICCEAIRLLSEGKLQFLGLDQATMEAMMDVFELKSKPIHEWDQGVNGLNA